MIDVARKVEQTRLDVVVEVDLSGYQFLRNVISRSEHGALPVESTLVNAGKPSDDLVREGLGAGTRKDPELRWIGIAHAEYLQWRGA